MASYEPKVGSAMIFLTYLCPMKLLHTADWHLGKRLEQHARLDEQREVLEELCELADREAVDAVLVAGDLFDHANPPIEAIDLFYQTLRRLAADGRRAVICIAGNHDAPDRIEAPDPLARAAGIVFMGYPEAHRQPFQLETGLKLLRTAPGWLEFQLPRQAYPLRIIATPYANEVRMRRYLGQGKEEQLRQLLQTHWQELAQTYCDEQGVNVLMTHLFVVKKGESTDGLEDESEKSVMTVGGAQEIYTENFPANLQYVALGHLHGYREVQQEPYPIVYSSSPLCYSVNDRSKQKYAVLVELEPGQPAQWQKIPLTSGKVALQQRVESMEEALKWLSEHPDTLVELTLRTDKHIQAQDRKRLLDTHPGIVRIIPEFTDPELLRFTSGKQIDLSRSMEELFTDYFLHKKGQPPNEDLLKLFREVLEQQNTDEAG